MPPLVISRPYHLARSAKTPVGGVERPQSSRIRRRSESWRAWLRVPSRKPSRTPRSPWTRRGASFSDAWRLGCLNAPVEPREPSLTQTPRVSPPPCAQLRPWAAVVTSGMISGWGIRIGVVLAACLALAGASRAQARWLAPVAIGSWQDGCESCTDPNDYESPQIAVAPSGAAVAAWSNGGSLEAAVRPPGGSWQAPVRLGLGEVDPSKPQVAINRQNLAVVVWAGGKMESSFRRIGAGGWSPPVAVRGPASAPSGLAIDAHGDTVMVWINFYENDEDGGTVLAAFRPAGSARWGRPVVLAGGPTLRGGQGLCNDPKVAFDGHGDAVALWRESLEAPNGSGSEVIESATRLASSGRWSTPIRLATARHRYFESPMLAVDSRGDAVAVWESGTGPSVVLRASTSVGVAGRWRSPVSLAYSRRGFEGIELDNHLVIDSRGEATLVFAVYGAGSPAPVKACTIQAQTGLGHRPVLLGHGDDVSVGSNSRGDVTVVWSQFVQTEGALAGGERGEELVTAASKLAGARHWGAPSTISRARHRGVVPKVGVDGAGHALAIWFERGGAVESAEAR